MKYGYFLDKLNSEIYIYEIIYYIDYDYRRID